MNQSTTFFFHRSHFGSRYQSGRCALRSPFSKPCKFESPSCHFSFPSEKVVKAIEDCFCGLAKSRRVSTNVKKTPAAATQNKLKMIPVRIRFESDSNPIRIRFESDSNPIRTPLLYNRGIFIKTQKKKKEKESASKRSIHKNAKTKKHNASTRSMTRGSFKNCL